ncbi:hypothetical protein D3C87_1651560 [compost metagenome]
MRNLFHTKEYPDGRKQKTVGWRGSEKPDLDFSSIGDFTVPLEVAGKENNIHNIMPNGFKHGQKYRASHMPKF